MDQVDAPLDDSNTESFCNLVKQMSVKTHFLFVSHNKVTLEMAQQLIGVNMQDSWVSGIVNMDIDAAFAFWFCIKSVTFEIIKTKKSKIGFYLQSPVFSDINF